MAKLRFKDMIIREDENYTFINKPPGISTLEDKRSETNILQLARKEYPESQVCHRLDKDTSGVLILAMHASAYKFIASLFQARKIKKVYHAVVKGLHDIRNLENKMPLLQTGRGKSKVSFKGKDSVTYFTTLDTYRYHSKIECIPLTGRTHQIRAHLQSINAPIVGDFEYGGEDILLSQLKKRFNLKKFTEELPLIKRMALHANSIEFNDMEGRKFHVEAPYPKDFAVLIKSLEKYR